MRNSRFVLIATATLALAAPTLSQAGSEYHDMGGEVGAVYHAGHVQATQSRATVLAELDSASKDGSLVLLQRSLPMAAKNAGPGKTRAEVEAEVLAARRDGTLELMQRNLPLPAKAMAR